MGEILLDDRLELELIFGALLARDLLDSGPARFGIEREPDAAIARLAHGIDELGGQAPESEPAILRLEFPRHAADAVAGKVGVDRGLQAVADPALDLDPIIL